MSDNVISWSQWEYNYKPITNPHSRDQGWAMQLFETFEPDINEVKAVNPNRVWTMVDNNPNSVYLDVVPGIHLFNRMGYFITEVPWTDSDMVVSNDPSYRMDDVSA